MEEAVSATRRVTVSVSLPAELAERAEKQAKRADISLSAFIRGATLAEVEALESPRKERKTFSPRS